MLSAPPGAALLKIRLMTKKSFADDSIRKAVKEVDVTCLIHLSSQKQLARRAALPLQVQVPARGRRRGRWHPRRDDRGCRRCWSPSGCPSGFGEEAERDR